MDTSRGLSLAYLERHPAAAAAALERVAPADTAPLLAAAEPVVAARALATMAPLAASGCLLALSQDTAAHVLEVTAPAIAAALLRRISADRAEALLGAVPEAQARVIRRLLRHREGLVGSLIDPGVPGLPVDQRVADALAWLRAHPDQTASALFLVNRDQTLASVLPLEVLLVADGAARLDSIGRPVTVVLRAASSLSAALASPAWWERPVLPVIDAGGLYLGALHYGALQPMAETVRRPPPSIASVQTLINLGELYWSGTGHVVAALATAVTSQSPARSRQVASGTGSTADDGAHAAG